MVNLETVETSLVEAVLFASVLVLAQSLVLEITETCQPFFVTITLIPIIIMRVFFEKQVSILKKTIVFWKVDLYWSCLN